VENGLALFSWPSLGTPLRYAEDETNVRWSVPEIEAFVRRLVERSPTGQVDLVAHSLGARGLLDALENLACELRPRVPIRQLVLVAPDRDAAVGAG
jgi:esterase/lipase superfamily enzyme